MKSVVVKLVSTHNYLRLTNSGGFGIPHIHGASMYEVPKFGRNTNYEGGGGTPHVLGM